MMRKTSIDDERHNLRKKGVFRERSFLQIAAQKRTFLQSKSVDFHNKKIWTTFCNQKI